MLRISKLADYGMVIMTYLAHDPEGTHNANEIATAVRVGAPTVSKILKALARRGLVISNRGAKGGYSLGRDAAAISVAEIIGAIEGPFGITECSTQPGLCAQEQHCAIRPNWQRVNGAVQRALEGVTLASMMQPEAQRIEFSRTPRQPARAI